MTDHEPYLPPSALYVEDVVERLGPITRQEILEETGIPERTLDDALDRLENCGRVHRTRKSDNLRQTVAESTTK